MLAEKLPEFTEMLDKMDELLVAKRPESIDEKIYQFLCFALSIKGRSKPCVLKHFKGALDAGATVEELKTGSLPLPCGRPPAWMTAGPMM